MFLADIMLCFQSREQNVVELGPLDLVEQPQMMPETVRRNSCFQAQLIFQNNKQMSD